MMVGGRGPREKVVWDGACTIDHIRMRPGSVARVESTPCFALEVFQTGRTAGQYHLLCPISLALLSLYYYRQ